ncbi:hypothetical protein C2845_PM03G33520 [Panicum miliaceum]|uniref:Uncharacterized protein n=1 Tax=Panicum miliaceum TaxID=4540 RepID=A0A3L6TAX6_PANMI|nr:hypothetical protein C2845_PM03G33520 [Panicum miliaceum]
MATRAWAAATAALNPPLLTRGSCSRALSASPARRSAAAGLRLRSRRPRLAKFECRRAKNAGYDDYKFPDPIPEFAEQETNKFREHMAWRLEQKKDDYFGEHVEEIVDICTQACTRCQILGSFLANDYCGPGTLLVHPFLDMKGEIKERGLPGQSPADGAPINPDPCRSKLHAATTNSPLTKSTPACGGCRNCERELAVHSSFSGDGDLKTTASTSMLVPRRAGRAAAGWPGPCHSKGLEPDDASEVDDEAAAGVRGASLKDTAAWVLCF